MVPFFVGKSKTLKCLLFVLALIIVGCAKEEKAPPAAISTAVSPETAAVLPIEKVKAPLTMPEGRTGALSTKDIKTLDGALKAGVPVIVKLGTDSCAPCRVMNQIIKELAVEQDGKAVFLSLDIYENRELASQAGVRVIPAILFYDKHGAPKAKSEGGMSKEDLLKAIDEMELNK
jgi:thioredoxin 1